MVIALFNPRSAIGLSTTNKTLASLVTLILSVMLHSETFLSTKISHHLSQRHSTCITSRNELNLIEPN